MDGSRHLRGLILDRTPTSSIESCLRAAGWAPESSRLVVQNQGPKAPLRDVWVVIGRLGYDWMVSLADDDNWEDLASLQPSRSESATFVLPQLYQRNGNIVVPVPRDPLTTQHVLHSLTRTSVLRPVTRYLTDAPTPWGGEDSLLLFLAQQSGGLEVSESYRYQWDNHNWTPEESQASIEQYLQEAGWGERSTNSTYLLAQSLDRLALAAYLVDGLSPRLWLRWVQDSFDRFWPVPDYDRHRAFARLPPPVRRAVINSRGTSSTSRLLKLTALSARYAMTSARCDIDALSQFEQGVCLVRDERTVLGELLPALRRQSPEAVWPQLDFWDDCIRQVSTHRQRLLRTGRPLRGPDAQEISQSSTESHAVTGKAE